MYDDQDTLNFEEECRKHEFRRSIRSNERNGWMTSRQIAQKINIGRRSLRRALCCMAWHNEIQRKKDETKRHDIFI